MSEEYPLVNAIQESLPENVTAESLPAKADVTQESSPVAPVETPTPKVEQKEPPFHEHPRWIERQRESELLRQQNQQLIEVVQKLTQPKAQEVDPYAGMTKEEKEFYQRIDNLAEQKTRKVLAEVAPQFQQELRETKETMAALAYERFLNKYPEVRPGSQEEGQIAELYKRGYSLDDARNLVFRDYDIQQAVGKGKNQQQVKVQQKVAANLEQKTLPPINGIPSKDKGNFRDEMRKTLIAAGL